MGASRTASGPDSVALAVLLGRSAGSQIALAAAAERLPGSAWILDTHERLRQYMGGPPAEFPQLYDAASALGRAGKDFPPTLMIQGGRDYVFAGPCGQVSTYAIERFLAAVLHGT